MSRNLALVLILVAGVIPLSADQTPSTGRFGALRLSQSADPYRKLFDAQTPWTASVQQMPNDPPKPFVRCGTTLLPGDPKIDPKAYVGSRQAGVDDTLRRVPPPACNSAR